MTLSAEERGLIGETHISDGINILSAKQVKVVINEKTTAVVLSTG